MRRGALQFEISRIGARSIHLRDKIFRSKYEYYIISAVSAGFSSFRSLAFCSSLSPTVPFFFSFFLRFFFFLCSLRLPNRMPALPQQLDCSSPLPVHRLFPFSFPIPIIFSADRQNVWLINTLRFHFSVACLSPPFVSYRVRPRSWVPSTYEKLKLSSNLSSTILSFRYLVFLVVLIARTWWMSSRATFTFYPESAMWSWNFVRWILDRVAVGPTCNRRFVVSLVRANPCRVSRIAILPEYKIRTMIFLVTRVKRTKANGKPTVLLSQDLTRNLFNFQDIETFELVLVTFEGKLYSLRNNEIL